MERRSIDRSSRRRQWRYGKKENNDENEDLFERLELVLELVIEGEIYVTSIVLVLSVYMAILLFAIYNTTNAHNYFLKSILR
jgi:hypothetical protein